MRIEKAIVEDEIDIEDDVILTQNTQFLKKIKCKRIISEKVRWDINAGDIDAGDINARNINAWDINARNINAWDINAWDIDAGDINARNINAWDINAWDIDAGDINAYWGIICNLRSKKAKSAKTISRIFVTKKETLEKKEW